MKRLLVLFLATFLLIGLAACGSAKDTMSFDSFRNQKTGVTLSLGMSRGGVEKLLGEGKNLNLTDDYKTIHENAIASSDGENQNFSYGEGQDFIAITYKDDCITEMSTYSVYAQENTGPSNWGVKFGLTHGNTSDDIFKQYEKMEKKYLGANGDGINVSLLNYFYDASGKPVESDAENAAYYISFCMDDSKNIILSCDIGKV